jgi:hypothetical protein
MGVRRVGSPAERADGDLKFREGGAEYVDDAGGVSAAVAVVRG